MEESNYGINDVHRGTSRKPWKILVELIRRRNIEDSKPKPLFFNFTPSAKSYYIIKISADIQY